MTVSQPRIGILGGGFGGLYTALQLEQFSWQPGQRPEIVLIDQRDRFLFLPLLYELITGELQSWEIAPPYAELLAPTRIRFCQDRVTGIDLATQRIDLASHPPLRCDRLVLALGGETPLDRVPGAADHALPFRSLQDAYRLQERLRWLENSDLDGIRVAIAGGGYSGVELACKLADRLGARGRIRLMERGQEILGQSPAFNRTAAQQALAARHIVVDVETTITALGPGTLSLSRRNVPETIPVDLVLWTVGTQVVPTIQDLPARKNDRGQLLITPTLQLLDYPHVFALGELAEGQDAQGDTIPATAQSALQQAGFVAWNLWASLSPGGEGDQHPLLPFRYQSLGEMLTLGIDNATLTGLGASLDGPLAYLARRLVYLYRLPTLDHQLKVGLNWMTQPLQQSFRDCMGWLGEFRAPNQGK